MVINMYKRPTGGVATFHEDEKAQMKEAECAGVTRTWQTGASREKF